MFYVYVLFSEKDRGFYTGFTTNLDERLKYHNTGQTPSTKFRQPLTLIFFEAYRHRDDALRREKYFKTTKGKATLKIMLKQDLAPKPLATLGFRAGPDRRP